MTVIMTKYKIDEKDFLIYDKNILSRDFNAKQWAVIANGQSGVGTDYIIEISGIDSRDIKCYDKYGVQIEYDSLCRAAAEDYLHINNSLADVQRIEVRFTDSYINRLVCKFRANQQKRTYIA